MDYLSRLVIYYFFLCFFLCSTTHAAIEKKRFVFSKDPIDVVIPTCSKDKATLDLSIRGAKKHIKNIRRIVIVSKERVTHEAEWYDENQFPFSKFDIALFLTGDPAKATDYIANGQRIGWYFQQLLKFYSPFVIPGISSNVLILDSDTIFLRDTIFTSTEGAGKYATGKEHNPAYFKHIARFLPGLGRVFPAHSGVVHHMLFQREILSDLFNEVENMHQKELWKVFCECVDPSTLYTSGASEYEIYFNYAFSKTNQVTLRPLKWKNIQDLKEIERARKKRYDYVSCHSWMRKK